jgi:hypothetical protein
MGQTREGFTLCIGIRQGQTAQGQERCHQGQRSNVSKATLVCCTLHAAHRAQAARRAIAITTSRLVAVYGQRIRHRGAIQPKTHRGVLNLRWTRQADQQSLAL